MKKKTERRFESTSLGQNIRFLRLMNGLSQTKLANILGLTRSKVATYESGAIEPTLSSLLKFCDYFGVTPERILTQDLSKVPVEVESHGDEDLPKVMSEFLNKEMQSFIQQTNDMHKVLEGYRTFYTLQDKGGEMKSHMNDMLELLETLINTNWKLIRNFTSDDEEE